MPRGQADKLLDQLVVLADKVQLVNDLTDAAKSLLQKDGKTWGLPYFSAIWGWNYNEIMMDAAGFKPFSSMDELVDQCLKLKRDRTSQYPLIWVANANNFQGTWFSLVWNRGGVVFDK